MEEEAAEPTPPGRVPKRILAVAAWLATLGVAAAVVGGHDAVAATEVNARLFGTLMLGAGCVLLAGAAGLRRGRPVGRALATVAALLGIALGALIFLAQVVNDEPDGRLILWAGIIVLSAAAVTEIRAHTPPEERTQGVWSQLPVLKSAISVGVLISAAQFWYTSIYIPTTAPASLTLEPKIEVAPAPDDQLAVKGTVTVRNTSGTRVNVLGSSLNLSGQRLDPLAATPEEFRQDSRYADRDELGGEHADRYVTSPPRGPTRVAHALLVDDGTYLEPGEVVTVPILTQVPERKFDALNLDVWLAIARGKVLATETEEAEFPRTKNGVVVLTAVPEAGWVRRLTRGDRFVRTEYSSDPEVDPEVFFGPDRGPHPPSDFDERLKRFYGFAETSSQATIPLPTE